MAVSTPDTSSSTDQRNDYVQSTYASPTPAQGVIGDLSIPSATRRIAAMKRLVLVGNDPLQKAPA